MDTKNKTLRLLFAAKNMVECIDQGILWRQDEFRKIYLELKNAVADLKTEDLNTAKDQHGTAAPRV